MALFLFGTLRYPPLLTLVLGRDPGPLPAARLADHAVRWAAGESFPLLVAEAGAVAHGSLLQLPDPEALGRVDFYEAASGHVRRPVRVETADGDVPAEVYVAPDDLWRPGGHWDLDAWAEAWGALTVRGAEELMDRFGIEPPEEVGRHLPTTRVRASSWVRAQADSSPVGLRAGLTADAVTVEQRRRPYRAFFMVEEQRLRFPLFDGGDSGPVDRVAFVLGDAVTLLPYDPARDRVMVIEQFRFGPFVRGDRAPWCLEPIAGRIDPGESPEQAARREAREEAALSVRSLDFVARYYPSPGGITEYIYSYVGLADLPDEAAGVGGVWDEHEDIRSRVLSFEAAMALLASGEAENAPLILSLQWLALHRPRLRGA